MKGEIIGDPGADAKIISAKYAWVIGSADARIKQCKMSSGDQ